MLHDPFHLAPARMHEAEGQGRHAFALFQAVRHDGPLIWITPARASHSPMLPGLPEGVGERLHLIRPENETDLLWSTEEALRSQPVGLVIAEPEIPMSLTVARRLQLAAEAGQTPGLMLIREGAGSNATETRWHCDPVAGSADSTLHRWSLKKNKKGTFGEWILHWNGETAAFDLVSKTGKRSSSATSAR